MNNIVKEQYQTTTKLNTRISFQSKYSVKQRWLMES